MRWMHIGTIRESGTWASACVTRWLYWDRTIAIIVIIIIAIILPYHHQHHHPPAILGQNNRNYHNNLALSSSSSSSGYIGREQLQLSQSSCVTIICSASSSDNNGINIIMFCHSKLQELCLYSCLKSFCLNYSGLNFSALTLSFQQQK